MIGSTRTERIALACFAVMAILITGGLIWATLISVELNRAEAVAEARDDYNRRLRTALWQIDPFIMNVFAKEAARPYWHYKSYFHPFKAYDSDGFDVTGSILTPSPLYTGEDIPEWILLYFQVSADQGWHSPQMLDSSAKAPLPENIDLQNLTDTIRLFMTLEDSYTPETFSEQVIAAQNANQNRWAIGEGTESIFHTRRQEPESQQQASQFAQTNTKQISKKSEFSRRASQNVAANYINMREEVCDNGALAIMNIDSDLAWDKVIDAPNADDISVEISPMAPFWMKLPNHDSPLLAMVRTVEIGNRRVMQGFLVDWSTLSPILLNRVSDLFGTVELAILPTGSTEESETTLTALPAQLLAGPEPKVSLGFWEAIPLSVHFAWGAAIVALLGVGFGIRTLLKTSERRSQFAYAVTHELRTPMTTLRLYTDMLADNLVPEEKKPEYLHTLRNESKRLAELVAGVLEYSRIENQKVRLDLTPLPVSEIARSIRERYADICDETKTKLDIQINTADGRTVETDPNLLLQVLGTLVDNACKYGHNGDDSKISVHFHEESGSCVIDVMDNGPGIPKNQRRQIFKPFRRGNDDSTGKPGGIGLGLALARSWTHLLGGKLELQPGEQTCFRITLNN